MFDVLDSALFRLLNDYARNSVLDSVLPFFSLSWPFVIGIILFFFFFTLYCRKHYGDALWRLLALVIVLSLSVGVSEFGAYLLKDGFERSRPYQVLSGTVYYDAQSSKWVQIKIVQSVVKTEGLNEGGVGLDNSPQKIAVLPSNDSANTAIENVFTDTSQGVPQETKSATLVDDSVPYTTIEELASQSVPGESGSGESGSGGISDSKIASDIGALQSHIDKPFSAEIDELQSPAVVPVSALASESVPLKESDSIDQATQALLSSYPILDCDSVESVTMFEENGYAMPSAFSANVMAMALVIALLFHKASPWIYLMPLLVGWSRVYTGNNFPLDILVGWIWGIIAVAIAWLICEMVFRSVSKNRKL